MRKDIRIVGAGGQGVILTSVLLAEAYGLKNKYNVSQTQSYGPEARGGACKAEVVVSDGYIDYMKVEKADVFVAFNQQGYDKYENDTEEKGIVLINSSLVTPGEKYDIVYKVPATEIAEGKFEPFVINMIMLGALTKLLPKIQAEYIREAIRNTFSKSVAEIDLLAFNEGYNYMEEKYLPKVKKIS